MYPAGYDFAHKVILRTGTVTLEHTSIPMVGMLKQIVLS